MFFLRRKPPREAPAYMPVASPWRAVAIIPGPRCQATIQAVADKRWLCSEAPRLPLPGCDTGHCQCRYEHLADRRTADRRRVDRTGLPSHPQGPEQRSRQRGRRASD